MADHPNVLEWLISPFADQHNHLKEPREIMERRNLKAHATLFWRGPAEAQQPYSLGRDCGAASAAGGNIELDFANENC